MDTEKFKMGWLLISTSGLIPSETKKLRRFLKRDGAHDLGGGWFGRPCKKQADVGPMSDAMKAIGTKETSWRVVFVTRAQWERSYVGHGNPS